MIEKSPPIRVAISGGGMAGACLLHALLQYLHLDVHIFESAPAFKEAGAAIGVTNNALGAMDLMGPSAVECLERAGAVPQKGVRYMLAEGPDTGAMIVDVDQKARGRRITTIVHRAAFLKEFLAGVDPDHMHASKKLVEIEKEKDGTIEMHFGDGTSHRCDVLVGADGIHSRVRKFVLSDGTASPRPTPWWAVLALKPLKEAQACLGSDLVDPDDAREYRWIGDGTYMIHNVLSNGQQVQLAIAKKCELEEVVDNWQKIVDTDEMKDAYKGWPPNLFKAVEHLLCGDQQTQKGIYFWVHPPAPTYVSGPVCIAGDAAHSTTPWQGSGGGMSIEDAMILSALLGDIHTVDDALVALEVYDAVRRPRTQRIVDSSRGTGMIMSGRDPGIGLDLQKMKERLHVRWDHITLFDNKKHRDEALKMLRDRLDSSSHSRE